MKNILNNLKFTLGIFAFVIFAGVITSNAQGERGGREEGISTPNPAVTQGPSAQGYIKGRESNQTQGDQLKAMGIGADGGNTENRNNNNGNTNPGNTGNNKPDTVRNDGKGETSRGDSVKNDGKNDGKTGNGLGAREHGREKPNK